MRNITERNLNQVCYSHLFGVFLVPRGLIFQKLWEKHKICFFWFVLFILFFFVFRKRISGGGGGGGGLCVCF